MRDHKIVEEFQAMLGGKCEPLISLDEADTDIYVVTTTFNTATIGTAKEGDSRDAPTQIDSRFKIQYIISPHYNKYNTAK